jgi:predicted transcriptional regulator of viral defense system
MATPIRQPAPSTDRHQSAALAALADVGGIAHTTDLEKLGVRHTALTALWRQGRLIRLKAGLYQLPESMPSRHAALVQASHAVPNGVICLVSALDFYGLTDVNPEAVWLAVPMGGWTPRVSEPPVRVAHFRMRLHGLDAEVKDVDGHSIRIYSREKTLCDCVRLPKLVGRDVALAALRRYLRMPGSSPSRLLEVANECRVGRKMAPYVEALVA